MRALLLDFDWVLLICMVRRVLVLLGIAMATYYMCILVSS